MFKKITLIILALVSNCVDAKSTGQAAQPAPRNVPVAPVVRPQQPVNKINPPTQRPAVVLESYKDLVNYVKTTPSSWDRANKRLNTQFVSTLTQRARAANLDRVQIESLLQTARDVHGVFTGNQNQDIAILQAVDNQIALAIQ